MHKYSLFLSLITINWNVWRLRLYCHSVCNKWTQNKILFQGLSIELKYKSISKNTTIKIRIINNKNKHTTCSLVKSTFLRSGSANILRWQLSLRVQQSDDMGEKAVIELCGPAPNAAEPLSRGQHRKQFMVRVVSDNIPSSGHAALGSNVLNRGERSPTNLLHCPHHSPHIPPVRGFAASTPHGNAAGQGALYGAPVECSEDGWDRRALILGRKCRHCCAFLTNASVYTDQVRLSVMCTPRNFVLLGCWPPAGAGP